MTKPSVSFCMTPEQFRIHGLAVEIAHRVLVMLTIYVAGSEESNAALLVTTGINNGCYDATQIRNKLHDINKEFDYGKRLV